MASDGRGSARSSGTDWPRTASDKRPDQGSAQCCSLASSGDEFAREIVVI